MKMINGNWGKILFHYCGLIVTVILTIRQLADRIVSCLVDKADPDFHQDDELGNRHSGLDPESVLMPRADPDFHQDDVNNLIMSTLILNTRYIFFNQ